MKTSLVVLLACAAACTRSPASTLPHEPERPPAGVWVDATGAVVGPIGVVAGSSTGPVFFDSAGRVWLIDRETAQLAPTRAAGDVALLYSDSSCTVPAYFAGDSAGPLPRQTFATKDGTTYVRADDGVELHLDGGAYGLDASSMPARCVPTTTTLSNTVFAISASLQVAMPSVGFAPPLHQEQR